MPEIYKVPADQSFPPAYKADHEVSFAVPNERDQEAWEYYMRGGKRQRPSDYLGPERRSRTSLIDRQIPVTMGMKMSSDGSKERDRLLNAFQDWSPTSLAEGRSVLLGQQKRANIAVNTPSGNGESALRNRVQHYQGYLIDAAHDLDALQSTFTKSDTEGYRPDPGKFRASEEAQTVVIKQLMFRSFLWDKYEGRWPAKNEENYKEREKYWRGFVMEAVKSASDDSVARLISDSYDRTKKRFIHWNREYAAVQDMPAVRDLIEKSELMPITSSALLSRKYQRVREDELEPAEPVEREPIDLNALLSPNILSDIERAQAEDEGRVARHNSEYDEEWDRLERTNRYTDGQIFQKLAARGLARALSREEQFEADLRREIEEAAERAAEPKPKEPAKKRRFKRYIGPKDTGPPEHIARQIRGDDL